MISYSYFPSSPAPTASTERGTRWFHLALRGLMSRIISSHSRIASISCRRHNHRPSRHFRDPVEEPHQNQPPIDPWERSETEPCFLKHFIIVRNFHRKQQQHNCKCRYFQARGRAG